MMPLGPRARISSTEMLAGHDLGVDVRLAHPAGDQAGVLGSEVDDEDGVGHRRLRRRARAHRAQWPMPTPWDRWKNFPSVCRDGATMTSAFWNSLTVSYPQVAIAVLSAPKRFMRPSFSWAGP